MFQNRTQLPTHLVYNQPVMELFKPVMSNISMMALTTTNSATSFAHQSTMPAESLLLQ